MFGCAEDTGIGGHRSTHAHEMLAHRVTETFSVMPRAPRILTPLCSCLVLHQGTIPPELSKLGSLVVLDLSWNKLHGMSSK